MVQAHMAKTIKDKNVAGILALFFGAIGVHRFYLGQVWLGVLYAVLMFTGISFMLGLIDAIVFFSMDRDAFDIKYNREFFQASPREEAYSQQSKQRSRRREDNRNNRRQRAYGAPQNQPRRAPTPVSKENTFKKSGIAKFKDYDYDGAIEDFTKALEQDPRDVAIHFNLACAYSLNEKTEKALYHLDQAVANGFDDFARIKEHDALAFLRIQDGFEEFAQQGYRLVKKTDDVPQLTSGDSGENDLLEQLKKLDELRLKGLLTDEEFAMQKRKIIG